MLTITVSRGEADFADSTTVVVDGVDDHVLINEALQWLKDAGGGILRFEEGRFNIGKPLIVTGDNIHVEGAGQGLTIIAAQSVVDGRSDPETGAHRNGALIFAGVNNFSAQNLTVDTRGADVALNGITAIPVGEHGTGMASSNGLISNTEVLIGEGHVYGIWSFRATDMIITNNHVAGGSEPGDAPYQEGIEVYGGFNVLIEGNRVEGISGSGIYLLSDATLTPDSGYSDIIVRNNEVLNSRYGFKMITTGAEPYGPQHVNGVAVESNGFRSIWEVGISLSAYSGDTAEPVNVSDVRIHANEIVLATEGFSSAGTRYGILLLNDDYPGGTNYSGLEITGNSVANVPADNIWQGFVWISGISTDAVSGNILIGNDTNQYLYGTDYADVLIGGAGNDRYRVTAGDIVIEHAGEGNDTVYAFIDYSLPDHVENLWLMAAGLTGRGNAENNLLYAHDGGSRLQGKEGDDRLYGGAGNDILWGNEGDDILYGGDGNDILYGGTGNNILHGGAGNDYLVGQDGSNIPSAGDYGQNLLYGGPGNDQYEVRGNDIVIEHAGEGNDTVYAFIDYSLPDHVENLWLMAAGLTGRGNAENNLLYAHDGGSRLQGKEGDDRLYGGAGNDILWGNEGDDILYGGDGNDILYGGTGNNILHGGAGNDYLVGQDGSNIPSAGDYGQNLLYGGPGNDQYEVRGNDIVIEHAGEGNDTVYAFIDYSLPDHVENLWLRDTASNGTGNGLNNNIFGNDLDNILSGGDGADRLFGGRGNDILHGGDGIDTAVYSGQSSQYQIETIEGGLRVTQTSGMDIFNDGIDLLYGIEFLQFTDALVPAPTAG